MNRVQRAEAEVPKQRWAQILVPGLVVLAIIIGIFGAWYARSGNDASQDVRAYSVRQDCKTVISSYRNEVLDARDELVFDGLVASATRDEATIAELKAQAPKLRDALHATPTASDIIEHGWKVPVVVRAVAPDLPAVIAACPK